MMIMIGDDAGEQCVSFTWFNHHNNFLVFQVQAQLHDAGYHVDVDLDHGCTLNKKVRNAQLAQYNFILGKFLYENNFTKQSTMAASSGVQVARLHINRHESCPS